MLFVGEGGASLLHPHQPIYEFIHDMEIGKETQTQTRVTGLHTHN